MRLSCNGCRVLRKGCTDACTIRPCLQWIKTPDAQANATVFLAKFYGRAGLLNLLAASPTPDQLPAVFRSLLYEACGRVVNPVYGAVGLLWSGSWPMCQAAVEAVLKGDPIVQLDPNHQAAQQPPHPHPHDHPHQLYDIRHVKKPPPASAAAAPAAADDHQPLLHKVAKPGRTRFKRTSSSSSSKNGKAAATAALADDEHMLPVPAVVDENPQEQDDQHQHQQPEPEASSQCHHASDDDGDSSNHRHQSSHDTDAEAGSHVTTVAPEDDDDEDDDHEQQQQQLGLDLTLGFGFIQQRNTAAAALPPTPPAEPGDVVVGFRFL